MYSIGPIFPSHQTGIKLNLLKGKVTPIDVCFSKPCTHPLFGQRNPYIVSPAAIYTSVSKIKLLLSQLFKPYG